MKIAIHDANILIDLLNIELFTTTLDLNFQFVTTDFVLGELNSGQITKLDPATQTDQLSIHSSNHTELDEIFKILSNTKQLSVADCSVFLLASKTDAVLLTGDRYLRKYAENNNLLVHGVIWILDQLIDSQLITKALAIQKLKLLIAGNDRLPKGICERRIIHWSK